MALVEEVLDEVEARLVETQRTFSGVGLISDVDDDLLRCQVTPSGGSLAIGMLVASNVIPMLGARCTFQQYDVPKRTRPGKPDEGGSEWVVTGLVGVRNDLAANAFTAPSTAGSATTTSGSFASIGGLPTLTLRKLVKALTYIEVDADFAAFSTAVTSEVEWGVRLTGPTGFTATDYLVTGTNLQLANVHEPAHGIVKAAVAGPIGDYVGTFRFRRSSGAGTITVNSDDYFNMAMRERWL